VGLPAFYTGGMDRWLDRLEAVEVGVSTLVLAAIFGSYIAVGVWAWIYYAWWGGLVTLVLPVSFIVWFAWDAVGVRTLSDARFRLRRLVAG
jgi:hypothetical protein